MEILKNDIERVLKDNDIERTLLLRFFDGFKRRNSIKEHREKDNIKGFLFGLVVGFIVAYTTMMVMEIISLRSTM